MERRLSLLALAVVAAFSFLPAQSLLQSLGEKQDYISHRISSYDQTGGNRDSLTIGPGQTAVLAEIKGPAAIHHIWVTAAAEAFYGRKLVLRAYWDGEESPSIEAPLGDFFGVGHGLDRDLSSLPVSDSSDGRARNCYWYMPFRWSGRLTITNEGTAPVAAFYYHIDYRELADIHPDSPYFHARYDQAFPAVGDKNYCILDAVGTGHYVGCVFNVLQRTMGWWGEGDDMIYVDGAATPAIQGTGSEDYFSDAWGMREGRNAFYGCPLQEDDFQVGSKASVYRFHVPDPVPFKRSIRVTIEHGHANDRSDYLSSVAFWYQNEPHASYPALPAADKRLPFAMERPAGSLFADWAKAAAAEDGRDVYTDKATGLEARSERLSLSLLPYYDAAGKRYPLLRTDGAGDGTRLELDFRAPARERYSLDIYFLRSPSFGNFHVLKEQATPGSAEKSYELLATCEGYSKERHIAVINAKDILLEAGTNRLVFKAAGRDPLASGQDLGFVGLGLSPSVRAFVPEWNLAGPFNAADMNDLYTVYPPEQEIDLKKKYPGKDGVLVGWRTVKADADGGVRFANIFSPTERVLAYGLAYVHSPDKRTVRVFAGSDDGMRVWVNDGLVHTQPAYRGASPDQDAFDVELKAGWNKVLVKVLQGDGGWGLYFRLADPEGALKWALRPGKD